MKKWKIHKRKKKDFFDKTFSLLCLKKWLQTGVNVEGCSSHMSSSDRQNRLQKSLTFQFKTIYRYFREALH